MGKKAPYIAAVCRFSRRGGARCSRDPTPRLARSRPSGYAWFMFIAAILVGLLVAYYFGLRPGMVAAGATVGLFLVAAVVPAAATYAYVIVCAGVAGVVLLGPKLKRPDALASSGMGGLRGQAFSVIRQVRRAVKQVTGKDKPPAKKPNRRAW
jgi:hypothetical protein